MHRHTRTYCSAHIAQPRFGAEGSGACPDGLWQRPASEYLDFIQRNKFNAIRFPVAVDNVMSDPVVGKWSLTANEDLQGLRSLAVLERLIELSAARGLLVVLDMHRLSAAVWPTAHGLWYSPEVAAAQLHDAWRRLARLFCRHWNVIAADVFNEPHGATWSGESGEAEGGRGWTSAASSLGQIVLSECPRWLIFVEGIGMGDSEEFCDLCFWGENLLGLRRSTVQLQIPHRLVFSPHVYGPGTNAFMYYFNTSAFPNFPDNMPDVWKQHWLLPARTSGETLVVGEWGGVYTGQDESWQGILNMRCQNVPVHPPPTLTPLPPPPPRAPTFTLTPPHLTLTHAHAHNPTGDWSCCVRFQGSSSPTPTLLSCVRRSVQELPTRGRTLLLLLGAEPKLRRHGRATALGLGDAQYSKDVITC